jgi:hypothetical protein
MAFAHGDALQVRSPSGLSSLLVMARDVLFEFPKFPVLIRSHLYEMERWLVSHVQRCRRR